MSDKPKESLPENPVKQWDQLAATLYKKELAPKGFSEIRRGPYKGSVQANIPFLPKHTVIRCQNIGAQLVRTYREKVKKELNDGVQSASERAKVYEEELKGVPWFRFGKRKELSDKWISATAKVEILTVAINRVEQIGIK